MEEQNQKLRSKLKKSIIKALLLFALFVILAIILEAWYIAWSQNGGNWLVLILYVVLMIPTVIVDIVSLTDIRSLMRKCEANKIELSPKMQFASKIPLLQIPVVALVLIISIIVMPPKSYSRTINLSAKYPGNNEVLSSCKVINDYQHKILIAAKLENFKYPITIDVDAISNDEDDFVDNYKALARAEKMDYQEYVKKLFGEDTISLMSVDQLYKSAFGNDSDSDVVEGDSSAETTSSGNDELTNATVKLAILLPTDKYLSGDGQDELVDNSLALFQKFGSSYRNVRFTLEYFFGNNFDSSVLDDYYIILSNADETCIPEVSDKARYTVKQYSTIQLDEDDVGSSSLEQQIRKDLKSSKEVKYEL